MRIEHVEGFMARYLGTEDNTAAREDARIKYFHLFLYLCPAVSSCRPNLSCHEKLKEKSSPPFQSIYASKSALLCGIE